MVPDFDELIFENRNKDYGAYELRRHYKTVTSFSIIGGVALSTILMLLLSMSAPDEVKAKDNGTIVVVLRPENLIEPGKIVQPETKRPVPDIKQYKYVAPKVVDDSLGLSEMLANDFATDSIRDGAVNDMPVLIQYEPENIVTEPEPEIRVFVEEPPMFPGGTEALLGYIGKNLKYPQEAVENNIQGKVFVKFAVWSDGTIKRVELLKGVNPLLDQEALRVVSSMPAWSPGKQNGTAVPVWFSMPVVFQLKMN